MSEDIRKAAIVVSNLDTKTADMILEHVAAEEADQVRRAIFELGPVTPEEQRRTIDEFFQLGLGGADSSSATSRTASKRSRAASIRDSSGPPTSPAPSPAAFHFLHETDVTRLYGILAGERPQVVAVVLSHLPSKTAGEVLAQFPPDGQSEIVRRLVDLEETDTEILEEIEEALRVRLAGQFPLPRRRVAGVAAVSGILKAADWPLGKQLHENIAARDHRLAERLQPHAMSFDELVRLDDMSLQTLMEGVDVKLLTLALVGAEPVVVDRVLGKLPSGDAALVRSDLNDLGPTRLSDVEEARRRIAQLAQRIGLSTLR